MELRLSIIVPMLNEAAYIEGTLRALQPLRSDGHEVIVIDGGTWRYRWRIGCWLISATVPAP